MAYYDAINLVKGDDLPALEIVLRDSNKTLSGQTYDVGDPTTWDTLDLTNVTAVRMKYRKIDSSTLVATITFSRVAPFTGGKVVMDWGATTLDDGVGDYEGEIEIEYTNGKFLTVDDKFKFIVREQF